MAFVEGRRRDGNVGWGERDGRTCSNALALVFRFVCFTLAWASTVGGGSVQGGARSISRDLIMDSSVLPSCSNRSRSSGTSFSSRAASSRYLCIAKEIRGSARIRPASTSACAMASPSMPESSLE